MKKIINYVLILIACTAFGINVSKGITLKQNVTGFLKRAADASTIKLANEELTKALNYIESNNYKSGYTSIFVKTPDEDLDYWYRNLKASQLELQNLKTESALEKTNVLIKLRETLLDSGERTRVTIPKGLSVFPHNKLWAVIWLVSFLFLLFGFINLAQIYEEEQKAKAQVEKK